MIEGPRPQNHRRPQLSEHLDMFQIIQTRVVCSYIDGPAIWDQPDLGLELKDLVSHSNLRTYKTNDLTKLDV